MEPANKIFILTMNLLAPSRIGDDSDYVSQKNVQDKSYSNYLLQNFYSEDCSMRKTIDFATKNVALNFCAAGGTGNQCGMNGCHVDDNSKLLLGSLQTHPKCKYALSHRPFLTVPYLGKGPYDPNVESMLQQTDTFSNNKKSVNGLSEVSYASLTQVPLIPSIKNTITNPQYLVEGAASSSWQRGGQSTRKQNIENK
jgi:hypothetical protein